MYLTKENIINEMVVKIQKENIIQNLAVKVKKKSDIYFLDVPTLFLNEDDVEVYAQPYINWDTGKLLGITIEHTYVDMEDKYVPYNSYYEKFECEFPNLIEV